MIVHLLVHGGVTGDIASLCAYIKGKSFDYATFEVLLAGAHLPQDNTATWTLKPSRSHFFSTLQGVDEESLRAANVCWAIFKSKRIVGGSDGKKVCELLLAKGADINCTSTTAVLTPLAHAGTATHQSLLTTLHLTFPFSLRLSQWSRTMSRWPRLCCSVELIQTCQSSARPTSCA